MHQEIPLRKDFIHHQTSKISGSLREVVFGAEDGMVSTLGALTGIAIGTSSQFTVILAGVVIVAVESTGMSIGSYLSNKSVQKADDRKLLEEREEILNHPEAEKAELSELLVRDGWSPDLAQQMSEYAATDSELMLKEMAYRELDVTPNKNETPYTDAAFMFGTYIAGGIIPVLPYFFLPMSTAIVFSIVITLIGLFGLGALTAKFTKENWIKSGLQMLVLASLAAAIGYVIGRIANVS